jgi:hypothetical protein
VGELAQAPHALAEHDHLLLAGHSGERLCGNAPEQRQPVPAAANRIGNETLADERRCERGLRVGQRLRVSACINEDADIPEDDSVGAGELGQRLPVQPGPGLERLELAQALEQSPVGLPPALADGVEQLGEGGVGIERERLRSGPRASTPACRGGCRGRGAGRS